MPAYDVIVVGAGPSGATVAFELAKSGLNVLILEKERFPRYKPCGGGLSLKTDRILKFSIKKIIEATVNGTYFTYKQKDGIYLLSDRPVAYMVMRDKFDSLLVSEAVKAGAVFMDGQCVKGVAQEKRGYSVSVNNKVFECRYVVGADGVNGVVRKFIYPRESRYIAASIEAEIPVGQDLLNRHNKHVHIDFGVIPYGYAWVFPKQNCLSTGIAGFRGAVKRPKEHLDKFIKNHHAINVTDGYKYRGYPIPLFRGPQKLTKGGIMLVGDGGSLVDPFFGEGIYYAMRSAQIASAVVSESIHKGDGDLTKYDMLLRSELYPEFFSARKIAQFVYTFPRVWYNVLTEKPALAEAYFNVLRGENRYEDFLKDLKTLAIPLMKVAVKKGFLQFLR